MTSILIFIVGIAIGFYIKSKTTSASVKATKGQETFAPKSEEEMSASAKEVGMCITL